jgi:hypothetical protein
MEPVRAVRIVVGTFAVAVIAAGCGESSRPANLDADGKEITAPVRPGLKGKAAEQMKKSMPHL